jgi:hypothetical protein
MYTSSLRLLFGGGFLHYGRNDYYFLTLTFSVIMPFADSMRIM